MRPNAHLKCGNCVFSVDPKSDHNFHPKSSKRNADLGRHHLEIEPNFASDGSQIDLYLRQLGRNRFTLKGTEFGSFDSNPRGISDHFTARSAREPGFFGTFRAKKARFTVSQEGISPRPKFRAIFQVVRTTFVARDSVSALTVKLAFCGPPARCRQLLVLGPASCKMDRISSRIVTKRHKKN